MRLSAAAIESLPRVSGRLSFVVAGRERPRNYADDPPPGVPQSTARYEDHTVPVHNLRPLAGSFTVDREGFQFATAPSDFSRFDDREAVCRDYYAEAAQLVVDLTGAARVVVFDHTLRQRNADDSRGTATSTRPPVHRVHVDFTADSGPRRAQEVLGDEADILRGRRYAVINVWRPIRGPLQDSPLAVSDAQSVAPGDLVATELVYPDRIGEFYTVRFNPAHHWFYAPRMTPDEVLLLKCFDQAEDGTARFAPHTAFDDPDAGSDRVPRASIEVRTLALFDA